MGSSTTKPRKASQVRKAAIAVGASDSAFEPDDQLTFVLDNPTEAGLAAHLGQRVVAVPRDGRASVESQAQILGWVPARFTDRIIGTPYGSAFVGQVVDVDPTAHRVQVTLARQQERS